MDPAFVDRMQARIDARLERLDAIKHSLGMDDTISDAVRTLVEECELQYELMTTMLQSLVSREPSAML